MVAGDEKTYSEKKRIFDKLSKKALYVGPSGMGTRAKLAVNLIVGLNRLVLAEGLYFAELMGLDPKKTLEIFKETQAYSRILDAKGEKMINNDFKPQSYIRQHRKDVSLMIKMTKENGKELPLSNIHIEVLDRMISLGEGELDTCSVIKEIKRMAEK
jgi:3-hydroxyisobutyrate dehydrogenase-like beta-hydroxyacid dehydrogenase